MVVGGREVGKLNGTGGWPVGWRGVVLLVWTFFWGRVLCETPNTGHRPDVGFKIGPERDEELDVLAELDDVEEGETHSARCHGTPELDDENHEEDRDSRDEEVEHEREPALDGKQEVEGPLGSVQQHVVLVVQGLVPAKGADGGHAAEGFFKERIERGFVLQV